jgi:transposase
VHVAGDKLFVDYAGMRPCLIDATTGEVIDVELFVAVLGRATTRSPRRRAQSVADFVGSVSRALTFHFGPPLQYGCMSRNP